MKRPEKYLDGTPIPRALDFWRKYAAIPLPAFTLNAERESLGAPLVWTLALADVTYRWNEADAPGLGSALQELLPQYHGAWHVARTQLGVVEKSQRGGKESAKTRRRDASKRDADLIDAAQKRLAKNPRLSIAELARQLSDRGFGGAEYLRKKLPKLLN